MNKNKGFLLVSVFIVLSDVIFIVLNYQASLKTLDQDTQDWAKQTENLFEIILDAKATSMQQLATYVANDPRIGIVFNKGKQMVQQEGGGAGKKNAALARQELFDLVIPSWEIMTGRYDVRQLHFHLGPGSTSFLRVHRPEKFGDNMDHVRYTVVDANDKYLSTKGFETGRVYSGIRGVVPVFIEADSQPGKEHVGALEAGTSFTALLQSLKEELDSEFCILLKASHVNENMWPDYVQNHFTPDLRYGDLFIESTTSNYAKKILAMKSVSLLTDISSSVFLKEPSPLQVCSFPLRDYRGKTDQNLPKSGIVMVWKDATERWEVFRENFFNNIVYAALALIIVETILFLAWKFSRKKLKSVIDQQTKEISENNKRLESLIDSLPTGIIVASYESGEIIEMNPAAINMIGRSKKSILGKPQTEFIKEYEPSDEEKSDKVDDNEFDGYHIQTSNGDMIPILKSEITAIIHNKKVLIISFSDITEHKEAEYEKIQREKLYGVIETAGAVCHELNQPLQSILGNTELVMMTIKDDNPCFNKLKTIKAQVDRMGEITKKLMSITKYETMGYLDGKIIDINKASE